MIAVWQKGIVGIGDVTTGYRNQQMPNTILQNAILRAAQAIYGWGPAPAIEFEKTVTK